MAYAAATAVVNEVRAEENLKTSLLAHQMVMMAASQDELHTSHSCGEMATRFGTTLHRARKILSPTEGKDISAAVMSAERRATHTGDPLLVNSHVHAAILGSHATIRAFSFREPTVNLHKFMRIRAKADSKIVEISQTVKAGTALEVLGAELVRTIPAEEMAALQSALVHVKAFGPMLTKLSGRLCVAKDDGAAATVARARHAALIQAPAYEEAVLKVCILLTCLAPSSSLANKSKALISDAIKESMASATAQNFQTVATAAVRKMSERAQAEAILNVGFIGVVEGPLKRILDAALSIPATAREQAPSATAAVLQELAAGTTTWVAGSQRVANLGGAAIVTVLNDAAYRRTVIAALQANAQAQQQAAQNDTRAMAAALGL